MRIFSQLFLVVALFVLMGTASLPDRAIQDTVIVTGSHSQVVSKDRTYQLYKGQTLDITVRSNFTLDINIRILFRNGTDKIWRYFLNNVTIDDVNGSFPFGMFGYKVVDFEQRFDQVAEVSIGISYSPEMVYPDPELRSVAMMAYPVTMDGKIVVTADKKTYDTEYFIAALFFVLAASTEILLFVLGSRKQDIGGKQMYRGVLYPFVRAEFMDVIAVTINVFTMFILFVQVEKKLFYLVLFEPHPSIPIDVSDVVVQFFFVIQAISGVVIYGNLDEQSLRTFWSLPMSKERYVLVSGIMILLRMMFFIVVDHVLLTVYMFSVVYGFIPSISAVTKPFLAHLRFDILVTELIIISILASNDLVRGSITCGGVLVFGNLILEKTQFVGIQRVFYVSTASVFVATTWLPAITMTLVSPIFVRRLARRYQLR